VAKNTDFQKSSKIKVFGEIFHHKMKDYDKIHQIKWFSALLSAVFSIKNKHF